MTYDELLQVLEDEGIDLEDTFLVDNIATIIERAQLRIQRDIDPDATRVEGTVSLNGAEVAVPADLVLMRGVRLENGAFLLPKDTSFIKEYWPDSSQTGTPKYYAWKNDTTLLVAPSTATATILELDYTQRIPVLNSTTKTTNWLSETVPDLLQQAMLYESAVWTKDLEQQKVYAERYAQTLDQVALEQNLRKRSDEYRRGEPRARVG